MTIPSRKHIYSVMMARSAEIKKGWDQSDGPDGITTVFAEGVTDEQKAIFLNTLGDLFESVGGRRGLKTLRVE